jgi:hypothetical protein
MLRMVMFNKNEILTSENRNSASFPRFNLHGKSNPYAYIDQYIQHVNDYYKDHFGFRGELLSVYGFCKSSLLGGILYPEKVVRGMDNWYFLGDSFNNDIKESKGIIYFSEAQLDSIEKNLNTIDKECKEHGIKLYVAIAPNKLSVYGKYLPIMQSEHPTKPEQVINRMKRDHFTIIDLKKGFSKYSDRRLFHRNDTHWNSFGAFLGYQTLMDFIVQDFPEVKALSADDYKPDTIVSEEGDLTQMLSIKIPEEKVIMKPKFESNTSKKIEKFPVPDYYAGNPQEYAIRYTNPGRPLKVLVYRDSFFDAMAPFIKESFGESVLIWYPYGRSLMDSEKPDLIIYEVVERDVDFLVNIHQYNIHL